MRSSVRNAATRATRSLSTSEERALGARARALTRRDRSKSFFDLELKTKRTSIDALPSVIDVEKLAASDLRSLKSKSAQ